MATTKTLFRVLLSSPSDLNPERAIVRKIVEEINDVHKFNQFGLQLISWEKDIAPTLTMSSGQNTIDSVFKYDESDLIIGMFYKKLGTPVLGSKSGTVHEIEKAIESYQKRKLPEIKLYFKKVSLTLDETSKQERENYEGIEEIRREYMELGIVQPFDEDFETLCRKHINQFFQQKVEQYHNNVQGDKTTLQKQFDDVEEALKIAKDDIRVYKNMCSNIQKVTAENQELHIHNITKSNCPISVKDRKKHVKNILTSLWSVVCETAYIPIHNDNNASIVLVYKKISASTRNAERTAKCWSVGWNIIHHNYKSTLSPNQLASSPEAAGLDLLAGETGWLFGHDKSKLARYHMHERDIDAYKETNQYGSLFGYRIDINNEDNELVIVAMLFISTFGKKICKSEKIDDQIIVENNYKTIIYPMYSSILQKELSMLLSPLTKKDRA
ncbi:MAG: DUF4062 domain-containing protein [Clostridiales bacterium]|nr:DUF4062 domain-containing protein [Clostridiales bacterium]